MTVDTLTRRVLAAVRVVDGVTGQQILSPLSVTSDGTSWVRNRRGFYVLCAAPGLESHESVFLQPPASPALNSLAMEVDLRDSQRIYLSRRRTIRLPRDPDPSRAGMEESLFHPIDIRVYLSPIALTLSAWSVIRATVVREGARTGLGGTLIRVMRVSDGSVMARGMSDDRGEALVAVPGIPVTTWEDAPGPVLATEVDVQVEAVWDPAAPFVPDPDDLETRRATLPRGQTTVRLASGRTVVQTMTVSVP